jgi:hypothetical protein
LYSDIKGGIINMKKLFLLMTAVVLLALTACSGSYVDPGAGGGGIGGIFGDDDDHSGGGGGSSSGGSVNASVFAGTWQGTYTSPTWDDISGSVTIAVSGKTVTITGTNSIPGKTITLTSVEDVTQMYKELITAFMPGATLSKAVVGITGTGTYSLMYNGDSILYMEAKYQGQSLKMMEIDIEGWGEFESD